MGKDKIKYTSQYLDNMSFDETYEQNAVEMLVENSAGTALVRQKEIATEANQDSLAGYQLAEFDANSDPIYIGKVDKDGNWFIKKIDMSAENATFFKGTTDFPTNWGNRASLAYDIFNNIF